MSVSCMATFWARTLRKNTDELEELFKNEQTLGGWNYTTIQIWNFAPDLEPSSKVWNQFGTFWNFDPLEAEKFGTFVAFWNTLERFGTFAITASSSSSGGK